jgi:hypothetical protein
VENVRMSDVKLGLGGIPIGSSRTFASARAAGRALQFGPIPGEERDRLACAACGFIFYVNPRLVVTTLPIPATGTSC